MTDEAMSPLRRRMIEDMNMRRFTFSRQSGERAIVLDVQYRAIAR